MFSFVGERDKTLGAIELVYGICCWRELVNRQHIATDESLTRQIADPFTEDGVANICELVR